MTKKRASVQSKLRKWVLFSYSAHLSYMFKNKSIITFRNTYNFLNNDLKLFISIQRLSSELGESQYTIQGFWYRRRIIL